MRFRAHESFSIRKGWLYKGMKNIKDIPDIFSDRQQNSSDLLGIGTNMVRALRYWLQVVELTFEKKEGRKTKQKLTDFGKYVWKYDRYIEEYGTLCLLHHNLICNEAKATSWFYFFNKFNMIEFEKEDFVESVSKYAEINGNGVAESSYEGDFNCLINTYLLKTKISSKRIDPEDNSECPLGHIGLISLSDKGKRIYRKTQPNKEVLHPLILLAIIIKQAEGDKEVKLESLLYDECNVGKTFNLDIISLTNYLYEIQQQGYIRLVRTAGLDVVQINCDKDYLECVELYYQHINNYSFNVDEVN